jgi:hypothetical protein
VRERRLLAGTLHLHEATLAGHDDVAVDLGVAVLDVGQIEQGPSAEDTHADGGDGVGEWILAEFLGVNQSLNRESAREGKRR